MEPNAAVYGSQNTVDARSAAAITILSSRPAASRVFPRLVAAEHRAAVPGRRC